MEVLAIMFYGILAVGIVMLLKGLVKLFKYMWEDSFGDNE